MPAEALPPLDLRIRVATLRDDIHLIAAEGEVDLFTAPTLWHTIENLCSDGVRTIIVDFAGVTFVDSTALGVLVSATKLLRRDAGNLYLTGARGALRHAASTAGLESYLDFRDSVADVPAAV